METTSENPVPAVATLALKPKAAAIAVPGNAKASGIVKAPRRKAFTLEDDKSDYLKFMMFGPTGTGKTYSVAELITMLGLRVAIITTDVGDTGHLTLKNHIRKEGKPEDLGKVLIIPLEDYGEVTRFLNDPWKHEDGLLARFQPDVLMWDGFSNFQGTMLSDYVGEFQPAPKDGAIKERSDGRESGLVLEQQDWGAIKNATIRKGDEFLHIRYPDGRPLHKIVTCNEAQVYKKNADGVSVPTEGFKPQLAGQGGVQLLGGFDLIMRTAVRRKEGGTREYFYVLEGSKNTVAKNRGFNLQAEEPASMARIWTQVMAELHGTEPVKLKGEKA